MLAPAIDEVFDLQWIVEVSVGYYWSSLPTVQREQLLQVFRRFTIATYVANFHSYGGEVATVSLTVRAVGTLQVVTSRMTASQEDAVRIDYVMAQTPDGWKVQDVLLDGTISRVATQRSDFYALLSQGNAAQLIAGLEHKISALSGGTITS